MATLSETGGGGDCTEELGVEKVSIQRRSVLENASKKGGRGFSCEGTIVH
jgi:hypothetical protein